MRNLGWANSGFTEESRKILDECKEKGHSVQTKKIGYMYSGYTVYFCDKCDYCYKVDSSG